MHAPFGLAETRGDLPPDGQAWPHPASTQRLGTTGSAGLVVPSAVVPRETTVLLNPLHPFFHTIEVGAPEPFPIAARF